MFTRTFEVRCPHCGDGVDMRHVHIQVRDNFRTVGVYHADRKCAPKIKAGQDTYWVFPGRDVTDCVPITA